MILARYILRGHVAPFTFGTSVIMVLFLLQYIMRWVDQLASKGLDLPAIGEFLVLNLSWIVVLAIPIGVLFSTVMAFGAMSASHEVTVMKASGIGLFRMMIPVIIAGVLLCGFTFWYTDNVLPNTNLRLSGMMRDIQRTRPTFAIESGQFTTHLEGYTILARNLDSAGNLLGVTIYDRSSSERRSVVSADTGRLAFSPSLTRLVIQLVSGEIHQRSARNTNDYRVVRFTRHQMSLPADRFFFEETDVSGSSRSDREMSIADMTQIVERSRAQVINATGKLDSTIHAHVTSILRADNAAPAPSRMRSLERAGGAVAGFRATVEGEAYRRKAEFETANKYLVEIHKKYAIPFACLLFVFVGCPLGIITRGGNFGISAAISLGFYVLYWIALIGGEKLADRGLMAPELAMWAGNVLIAIIGAFVTMKVNYESSPLSKILSWFRRA